MKLIKSNESKRINHGKQFDNNHVTNFKNSPKSFNKNKDEEEISLEEEFDKSMKYFEQQKIDYLDDDASSIDSDGELLSHSHRKTLDSLKEKDPEFYEYLQKHDKELLEFNDDEVDQNILSEKEPNVEDEEDSEIINITVNDVNKWKKILQNPSAQNKCLVAIKSIIKAFHKASNQTNDSSEKINTNIMNSSLFNLIINTSLFDLLPALMHYLRLKNFDSGIEIQDMPEHADINDNDQTLKKQFVDPRCSHKWKRVIPSVKMYLTDILKMMCTLSIEARISFERHILELIPFYNAFPHLLKRIIRRSINEWYSGKERSRVLAFLILYRIIRVIKIDDNLTKFQRHTLINHILRQLYLTYVVSSKNTNETTIDKIVFMRNSLIELYDLEHSIAYQQSFIFMRQLSINLRKSVMAKEKDSLKKVYNWQFVHSINLWSQMIGLVLKREKKNELFLHLLSPICNISLETLRIFYAFKYVPFKLQIIDPLSKLVSETGYLIPVLRLICEIIWQIVKNRKEIILKSKIKNKSKKQNPINLNVILKVSKEQTLHVEFIEKVVEKLYEQSLYYLKSISYWVSFPETIVSFYKQCRSMIKSIPFVKGQTMFKQLLSKCDENAKFIMRHRQQQGLLMKIIDDDEEKKIEAFENNFKNSSKTPLIKFYEQWKIFKNKNEKNAISASMKLARQELSKKSKFDVNKDLEKSFTKDKEKNFDKFEDFNDSQLNNDIETESISEFGENDEVELNEEQMKLIQAKIEKEENFKKRENKNKKRKRKNRNKNKKKPRSLNPNLQLEAAFDMSSDDDANNVSH